jgi:hypothetical protein
LLGQIERSRVVARLAELHGELMLLIEVGFRRSARGRLVVGSVHGGLLGSVIPDLIDLAAQRT